MRFFSKKFYGKRKKYIEQLAQTMQSVGMRNFVGIFGIFVGLCVSPASGLIISEFIQDVCDQP